MVCYTSIDGRFWDLRGTVAPHEPGTNRMNVAAGRAGNGDLLVLASSWTPRPPRPVPVPVFPHDTYVPPTGTESVSLSPVPTWVCRSSDGGRTWGHTETVATPAELDLFVPFGDICPAADGDLLSTCYGPEGLWTVRSQDDGATWPEHRVLAEGYNETALLPL